MQMVGLVRQKCDSYTYVCVCIVRDLLFLHVKFHCLQTCEHVNAGQSTKL